MAKDDRLLTAKEYEQFLEDCDTLSQQQSIAELTVLCELQQERIHNLQLYVKMLEELNTSRSDKLTKLQHVLQQLEKEVIELRCLVPKVK